MITDTFLNKVIGRALPLWARVCSITTYFWDQGAPDRRAMGGVMQLREPGVCVVDVAKGELAGATNRYVKTMADLAGLYEDEAAFRAQRNRLGDTVVYEVTDYKPSANA